MAIIIVIHTHFKFSIPYTIPPFPYFNANIPKIYAALAKVNPIRD
jgi:hypothetical protein